MKLANQELERKISSLQAKFERKNTISNLQTPAVNQENGMRDAKKQNAKIFHKSSEAKIHQKSTDNISGNEKQSSKDEGEPKEQCVFELTEEGSCTRRKCNFSHEIKPEMRKDQVRNKKMQELSQKEKSACLKWSRKAGVKQVTYVGLIMMSTKRKKVGRDNRKKSNTASKKWKKLIHAKGRNAGSPMIFRQISGTTRTS